ncbi:MAG: alanine dehydrogenase, alanine dehydrogenase [Candidatus Peregrinibacteria bacterium GW2011_GWF2_38_29]|nr:MAG: alanine dehydrogenase, alanine dehydrogenase [Candidatus Peregrinibacteria bacterium GW2011_GWF2_38_29]HBB03120.1 alanine dehydrogenase [Candidatus Peregrinibacteria bacterium]
MIIGVLKEIKDNENRVGLTPSGAKELVGAGHTVLAQNGAGVGSGFSDEEYSASGAQMIATPDELVEKVDILVKVKEPIPAEYPLLAKLAGKTLYTYLHLSGVDPQLTQVLLDNKITGVAYETVVGKKGGLPLLAPMSDVAGVLAVQYAAQYLQKKYNGFGITMGVIPNTDLPKTVVVGGGVVGARAAKTAAGMGGKVVIFDMNPAKVEFLKKDFKKYLGSNLMKNVQILVSEPTVFAEAIKNADVVIGAVLVPGAKAPRVVTEEHVKSMKNGSVLVDVAIDQGGCIWGSKATSHSHPIYEIEGKIFCCVANMPGQVSRHSTQALTFATITYLMEMANKGVVKAIKSSLKKDGGFAKGVNTYAGKITWKPVAEDLGRMADYSDLMDMLGMTREQGSVKPAEAVVAAPVAASVAPADSANPAV